MDFVDIDLIFNAIMSGNSSILTVDNIKLINDEALRIYSISSLNEGDINELKKIIMICNVLYNRTDMTVLPVEDGFYDLLLEKYKTYDSNFQVGSAVVEFRNFVELDLKKEGKSLPVCPIVFNKMEPKDEVHQYVFDNIMGRDVQPINIDDFKEIDTQIQMDYVTKRTHNTSHNHPTLVGTLDKCKFVLNQDAINAGVFNDPNVKILERDFFQDHIRKGIINPNQEIEIVAELKYDGISVEADCGTVLDSARTRGDTGIGVASDITPMLKGYPFRHASVMEGEDLVGVKFEAIMTKSNLEIFNKMRNRSYANCRSAIVGLFGASDGYLYRDLITLVPLALDRESFRIPIENRVQEIEFLNEVFRSHGEPLRYCILKGTIQEILFWIKAYWDEAKAARPFLNFMYDGIVISYLDEGIREALGRKNYINKYSMAVKFDPLEKQTIFRGFTYEVGQHGNITPMIHYDPVEFIGTIHTKSTGSSFARFQDMGLKYGDYINVTYRNDVMPYVSRIDCEHNRNNPNPVIEFIKTCPICGSELVLSDSGKNILCNNIECPGRSVQRMVNMFSKLNIKGFADAAFNSIAEKDHLYKLYENIPDNYFIEKLGVADGNNMKSALLALTNNGIKDYIIIGSLGFTGIAHKKWQMILEKIRLKDIYDICSSFYPDYNMMKCMLEQSVPKIGTVTAYTIAKEFEFFKKDIEFILLYVNLIESFGTSSEGKMQIRFTGFRNQQLSEQLCNNGYDADDNASLSKKTDILLIPYEGFNSSKVAKAMNNPHTKIVAIDKFLNNIKDYIGEDIKLN